MFQKVVLEEGFELLIYTNTTDRLQILSEDHISIDMIQFHFGCLGKGNFIFNSNYKLPIIQHQALLLYNPQKKLPIQLKVEPKSTIITLLVEISHCHSFFSDISGSITFLSLENQGKKYYHTQSITPNIDMVLQQILQCNLHFSVQELYYKAKCYELLSLFFNHPTDTDKAQQRCPFLADEKNVLKIKKAKEIMIQRLAEPPTLQELSKEIELPLQKLKEGFKQLYGYPVYTFIWDYKMDLACQLLRKRQFNVNEIALKMGYSTASHFIAAFKKKHGITPKKYIQQFD